MLRREGHGGAIVMISADDSVPYDRPNLSKDYLAGTASDDWIPLRSEKFYTRRDIELLLNTRVSAIDPRGKTVRLPGGGTRGFDALLQIGRESCREGVCQYV